MVLFMAKQRYSNKAELPKSSMFWNSQLEHFAKGGVFPIGLLLIRLIFSFPNLPYMKSIHDTYMYNMAHAVFTKSSLLNQQINNRNRPSIQSNHDTYSFGNFQNVFNCTGIVISSYIFCLKALFSNLSVTSVENSLLWLTVTRTKRLQLSFHLLLLTVK